MTIVVFLEVEDVEEIHAEQIEEWGGQHGVRSAAGLESAVMSAQATFDGRYLHPTIWDMAAAYAYHIAEAQAFIDGNKRAALRSALIFLDLNGEEVDVPDGPEQLYEAMIRVSSHELDKPGLAALFRQTVRARNGAVIKVSELCVPTPTALFHVSELGR